MNEFWTENKWYLIAILFAVVGALIYIVLWVPTENLLPNDYSVM